MNNYIALLRGINVGGHKKFSKVDQLQMLEDLGFIDFQVYLHTGNWIFRPPSPRRMNEEISSLISQTIKDKYGWEVPVLVFKTSEISQILNNCPFKEDVKEKSYFTLMAQKPKVEHISVLNEYQYPNEEYHLTEKCIYFYPANGAGKAKMSNNFFENKLKVTATSRNFKTMTKLVELSNR